MKQPVSFPVSVIEANQILLALHSASLRNCSRVLGTYFFSVSTTSSLPNESAVEISIECPWRLEKDGSVLVGQGDHHADDLAEIDRLLERFLGKREGETFVCDEPPLVTRVLTRSCGDLTVSLSNGLSICAFSSSVSQMEWMVRIPGEGYLARFNGAFEARLRMGVPKVQEAGGSSIGSLSS